MTDSLKKYLNSESAQQLLMKDNVEEFLRSSYSLLEQEDYKQLIDIIMLNYDIFNEISSLVPQMFVGVRTLDKVALDGNCTGIPAQCFQNSSISAIDGMNVQFVGAKAFSNCDKLVEVDLPKLEGIGSGAFSNCSALTKFDLSKDIKRIGTKAFAGCTSLKQIHYHGTKEEISKVFFGSSWDGSFDSSNIKIICTDGEL